jgi:hypothetical protein
MKRVSLAGRFAARQKKQWQSAGVTLALPLQAVNGGWKKPVALRRHA